MTHAFQRATARKSKHPGRPVSTVIYLNPECGFKKIPPPHPPSSCAHLVEVKDAWGRRGLSHLSLVDSLDFFGINFFYKSVSTNIPSSSAPLDCYLKNSPQRLFVMHTLSYCDTEKTHTADVQEVTVQRVHCTACTAAAALSHFLVRRHAAKKKTPGASKLPCSAELSDVRTVCNELVLLWPVALEKLRRKNTMQFFFVFVF